MISMYSKNKLESLLLSQLIYPNKGENKTFQEIFLELLTLIIEQDGFENRKCSNFFDLKCSEDLQIVRCH